MVHYIVQNYKSQSVKAAIDRTLVVNSSRPTLGVVDILLTKYNSALLYFVKAILMMQFVILRTCLGLSVPEIWSPPYLLLVGPIYLYYSSYTTSIPMQK